MIGLAGLIDNLLTAKVSPPLDVAALQRTGVAAPGPVLPTAVVDNDVRLPSHAALDRLIPAAPLSEQVAGTARGPGSAQTDLSVAARAISVVLAQLHGDAGPVRGTAPAWPASQAPLPSMLADALAQVVSESGLFYESHLAKFAEGTRSQAQLLREPQGRWAAPGAGGGAQANVAGNAAQAAMSAMSATAGSAGSAGSTAMASSIAIAQAPAGAPAIANGEAKAGAPGTQAVTAAPTNTAGKADDAAMRLRSAYGVTDAPAQESMDAAPDRAMDISRTGQTAAMADARSAGHATAAAANAGPVIHPQGVTLVHQQLDLLATDAFRWTGQAWPGVPMTWSIESQAEPDVAQRDGAPAEEGQRSWSTTVQMHLPRLGMVDIHLTLAPHGLQARLTTGEMATATRLRAQGGALTKRLGAAGLKLHDFQVAAKGQA